MLRRCLWRLGGSAAKPPTQLSAAELKKLKKIEAAEQKKLDEIIEHVTSEAARQKAGIPQHHLSFPLDSRNKHLTLLPPGDLWPLAKEIRENVFPRATPGVASHPGVLHVRPRNADNVLCDFMHVVSGRKYEKYQWKETGAEMLLWTAREHFNPDARLLDFIGFVNATDAAAARADKKSTALWKARKYFAQAREMKEVTAPWCLKANVITIEELEDDCGNLRELALQRLSRRAAYIQLPELKQQLQEQLEGEVEIIVAAMALLSSCHLGKEVLPEDCRVLTAESLEKLSPALGQPLRAASFCNGGQFEAEEKQKIADEKMKRREERKKKE